jgi:hypothetical protein
MSLYQHRNEMHTACMTSDFISALSATLFPIGKSVADVETDTTTPDDNKVTFILRIWRLGVGLGICGEGSY